MRTAARMSRMSLPILVSCIPVLSNAGILGRSWRPLWEPESPRLALSELRAYQWDYLYHRMRHRPVGGIDRADASLSPRHAGWEVQNGTTGPISGDFQRPFHSQISYGTGLTDAQLGRAVLENISECLAGGGFHNPARKRGITWEPPLPPMTWTRSRRSWRECPPARHARW